MTSRSWPIVWGGARGPATSLSPRARLVAGAGAFAASMIAPSGGLPGVLFIGGLMLGWLAVCQPPLRLARATLLLGLTLFLPYFLLIPLLPGAPTSSGAQLARALAVPTGILVRGLGGMMISVSTVSTLSVSDLREALVRLPVPGVIVEIVLQIVHQTETLVSETERIGSAMAIRGASTGVLTGWRVLASLPRVWLPRVIDRAERVAATMELRGFGERALSSPPPARVSRVDGAALLLTAAAMGLAVALRLGSVG